MVKYLPLGLLSRTLPQEDLSKPSLLSSCLGHFSLGRSDSLSVYGTPHLRREISRTTDLPHLLSSLHPFPGGFYQRNGVPRSKHSGEVKVFPAREHVRSWLGLAKSLPLNIPMGLNMGPATHLSPARS